MKSITIKNLPADLLQRLKESSAANNRSLNKEIIVRLEEALMQRSVNSIERLADARKVRARTGSLRVTQRTLDKAKRGGRR